MRYIYVTSITTAKTPHTISILPTPRSIPCYNSSQPMSIALSQSPHNIKNEKGKRKEERGEPRRAWYLHADIAEIRWKGYRVLKNLNLCEFQRLSAWEQLSTLNFQLSILNYLALFCHSLKKLHAYEDINRMTKWTEWQSFIWLIFIALALCLFCHSVKKFCVFQRFQREVNLSKPVPFCQKPPRLWR